MSAPGSRVRPYPWDARLGVPTDTPAGRIGLMLVPNDSGLLVGKKQQTLEGVVPTIQEYDSAPIYRERTFAFKPTAGMGERVQSSHADRRYYWGSNVWVTGGLVGKGPLVHSLTPALAAARVTQFVDGINAARTPTQYILRGDSILRRNDDTSAGQVVLHTRAGHVATSAVRWMAAGAGATDALYVAWEDGVLERFVADTTWAPCVLPAGFAPSFLEIVGDELWGADPRTSQIRKTTADPMLAGSWGGSIQVGDQSTPITCIRQAQNHLAIFKADGDVFTIDVSGADNDLYPGLKVHQDTENGRTAVSWLDSVWFTAGPTFYRLSLADAPQLSPAGPGRMLDNASPVHGPVLAFCGWGGYQAFAGVYNAALNASYLLTYGNWQPSPERDSTGFTFVDQYDGSIADFPGKKISAMGLSSQLGQDRLYVGFSDGTFCWIKLIRNPLAVDSGAEYTDQISEIVLPLHTAMFQADTKAFLGFSVFGPVMRQGDEVNLAYRLMASSGAVPSDPTGNWVVLPTSFEHNGQRVDSPINLAATAISLKATFVNSIPTATPVIDTIAVHERVVPAFKRDYTGTIDARPNAARRDGATSRIPPARTRSAMIEAAATPNAVTLELPDETLQSLAMFGYQERQVPHSAAAGQGWLIDFQATQFATIGQYGIIRRLRGTKIKDLRGYPIRLLKTL